MLGLQQLFLVCLVDGDIAQGLWEIVVVGTSDKTNKKSRQPLFLNMECFCNLLGRCWGLAPTLGHFQSIIQLLFSFNKRNRRKERIEVIVVGGRGEEEEEKNETEGRGGGGSVTC